MKGLYLTPARRTAKAGGEHAVFDPEAQTRWEATKVKKIRYLFSVFSVISVREIPPLFWLLTSDS